MIIFTVYWAQLLFKNLPVNLKKLILKHLTIYSFAPFVIYKKIVVLSGSGTACGIRLLDGFFKLEEMVINQ